MSSGKKFSRREAMKRTIDEMNSHQSDAFAAIMDGARLALGVPPPYITDPITGIRTPLMRPVSLPEEPTEIAVLREIEFLRAELKCSERRLESMVLAMQSMQSRLEVADKERENLLAENQTLKLKQGGLPAFVRKHIRFLLLACHPDRHGSKFQSVAGEVIRELIKIKEGL